MSGGSAAADDFFFVPNLSWNSIFFDFLPDHFSLPVDMPFPTLAPFDSTYAPCSSSPMCTGDRDA